MKNTHVTILIDASSSMNGDRQKVKASITEYVDMLRKDPEINATITVKTFTSADDQPFGVARFGIMSDMNQRMKLLTLYERVPAHSFHFDVERYVCSGMTPLYDAVGETVETIERSSSITTDTGKVVANMVKNADVNAMSMETAKHFLQTVANMVGPSENNILVIMTDGMENYSSKHSQFSLQTIMRRFQENNVVVYLGADHDAMFQSQSIGIRRDTSMSFAKSAMSDTMGEVYGTTRLYASGAATANTVSFSDASRTRAMGATAKG